MKDTYISVGHCTVESLLYQIEYAAYSLTNALQASGLQGTTRRTHCTVSTYQGLQRTTQQGGSLVESYTRGQPSEEVTRRTATRRLMYRRQKHLSITRRQRYRDPTEKYHAQASPITLLKRRHRLFLRKHITHTCKRVFKVQDEAIILFPS